MKKVSKIIIALILFFTFTLGLSLSMVGPQMKSDCLMAGVEHQQSAVCDMSVLDHITYWESLFAAILNNSMILLLVAIAALLLTRSYSLFTTNYSLQTRKTDSSPPEYQLHIPLKLAYARGLIAPKLCA